MKKHLHLAVVFLCIIALSALSLPLFSVRCTGQQVILWGWDLWHAALWGKVVLVTPVLLVAVMYLQIIQQHRNLFLALLSVGFCSCYAIAICRTYHSIELLAFPFVRYHYGIVVYPQLILAALLIAWIRNGGQHEKAVKRKTARQKMS